MSDDDRPDNVRHLPRIGSPPPPPVPSPPSLGAAVPAPAADTGHVRISAFDAPDVPHPPPPPPAVPATLRSDGLDPAAAPDAGPPRAGALSLAAILAIALAAFEGLHTWIKESGPRRAEAASHQREIELLAAKANADANRHGAEADAARAKARRGGVPQSSHDYGRSTLGRGTSTAGRGAGGPGRGAGGIGPASTRTGRTGPHSVPAGRREPSRTNTGSTSAGSPGTGRGGGSAGRPGSGSAHGRNGGPTGSGTGIGTGRAGSGKSGGGAGTPGSRPGRGGGRGSGADGAGGRGGRGSSSGGGSGRRSPRQVAADWWGKGKKSNGTGSTKTKSSGTGAAVRDAVKNSKTPPTFWDKLGDRKRDQWKAPGSPGSAGGSAKGSGGTGGPARVNDGRKAPNERVGLPQALWETVSGRWEKRRERWKDTGGPRPRPRSSSGRTRRTKPSGPSGKTSAPGPGPGPSPGPGPGPGAGTYTPRDSPFDADTGPAVTITVEQAGPARSNRPPWEPDAVGRAPQPLPQQSQPALPRAPQRPAGPRPGTTRRKEPIAVPPAPARTASTPNPVQASVPSPHGMAARHATDITLHQALKTLTDLTTSGMETHDDCTALSLQARRLLGDLETMAHDLAHTHNVRGQRTTRAVTVLMEQVGQLIKAADQMARDALEAAELAEAEEADMARDYRPTQAANVDAGLAAPSARIHNEN